MVIERLALDTLGLGYTCGALFKHCGDFLSAELGSEG
jgi:hypothetical protein